MHITLLEYDLKKGKKGESEGGGETCGFSIKNRRETVNSLDAQKHAMRLKGAVFSFITKPSRQISSIGERTMRGASHSSESSIIMVIA